MNPDELSSLNEQITALARAGLPLDQGLEALARDMGPGRLRRVTAALAGDLRAGHSLPDALDRQRRWVPAYYARLVHAGVRSNRLPDVLITLTSYVRALGMTRTILADALFYPVVVLTFAALLFAGMVIFVIPHFDRIYQDFDMALPGFTVVVLNLGRNPLELVVLPVLAVVGLALGVRWVLRLSERGRETWAGLVYAVPIIGTLIRAARLAAFSDLLAVLVEFNLPLPEAFLLAGEASSDPAMTARARVIQHRLGQGMPLGEALRGGGLLPDWVAWMTEAGQQNAGLAATLRQVAGVYRRQVDERAGLLRNLLPSFLIVVTAGFLVGSFVIALMLPMIKLIEGLSK